MTQTKKLEAEEAERKSFLDRQEEERASKFLSPDGDTFVITPITTLGEFVAIAPLAPELVSEGGIVIPEMAQGIPDIGLVVGVSDITNGISIGDVVKFSSKHAVCELTDVFQEYGGAQILVVRDTNIFAFLPKLKTRINA